MNTQLTTFIARWYNRFADWDGVYGSQCFDLIQFWSAELQGGWIPGLLAKDIMDQFLPNYEKIWNSPDNIPQAGDIVVWGGGINGGLGHTAIATGKGDVWTFQVFSQNDPVGSPCIYRTYTYSYVRGWLRRKVVAPPTPNADEYVLRLSQALTSAENAITSGEQVGDKQWKTKNKANKSKLTSLAARL